MGTTCSRILFAVFAIIFYGSISFSENIPTSAHAAEPPKVPQTHFELKVATEADEYTAEYTGKDTGCNNASKVPLKDITYVGFRYAGKEICVDAKDDETARKLCQAKSKSYVAVNPANPQYGTSIKESRSSNSYGFYYCVEGTPSLADVAEANPPLTVAQLQEAGLTPGMFNDKANLCGSVAPLLSPWRTVNGAALQFVFSKSGITDGDCQCRLTDQDQWQNCDQAPPAGASTLANVQNAPVQPPATPLPVGTDGVTVALNRCIEQYTTKAEECKTEAQKAVDACDERNPRNAANRSSIPNMASGATQIMGTVYNMQHQASGMQAECFRAGAAANTASTAIRGMQQQCVRDSGRCQALCKGPEGKTSEEEFKEVCARTVGKTVAQLEQEGSADSQAFAAGAAAIRETSTEGLNLCRGEVKKKSDTLDSLLNGVGRALQASVQCACQTSSGGTNCQNIPSVQDCSQIPQPAGCGVYDAMDTCSMGSSSYNAKNCACMQNPSSPGCGGGSSVSAFSGPPLAGNVARATPGGGVSFGGGPSGAAGNLGIGGGGQNPDASDLSFLNGKPSSGAAPGGAAAAGGGTAGGGAAGNGAADGDKIAGEQEEKGIGGIFNAARTYMSNALGLGKKPLAKKESGNGSLGKPDMGRFKPLRGLASRGNGMGTRNMDIWKMMNSCTSGETCKSNENNYLVSP